MATSATPTLPEDAIVVGRIVGSYGIRGWLRVEPFNDPEDSVLLHARRWYVHAPAAGFTGQRASRSPDVAASALVLPAVLQVEQCRVHGGALVAGVAGIDVRELAESLRGCEISVSRSEFPAPEAGEFYWVDLIGCQVITPQGVELGVVASVDDHGAHPLLGLRASDGRERLVPFVAAHISEVDLSGRRIVADWDPDF